MEKKNSNEANFTAAAYRGDSSNLQCFFPIFHHFIEGSLGSQGLCTDALESMRALRRITMELRKITREEAADLEHLQQLQILHHSLTRAAFGYDHIRPKHHARFHLPKQLKQSGFHADCFPGEKNTSCTSLTLAYIVLTLGPKAKTGSLAISCC
jgi:hypothetical protein